MPVHRFPSRSPGHSPSPCLSDNGSAGSRDRDVDNARFDTSFGGDDDVDDDSDVCFVDSAPAPKRAKQHAARGVDDNAAGRHPIMDTVFETRTGAALGLSQLDTDQGHQHRINKQKSGGKKAEYLCASRFDHKGTLLPEGSIAPCGFRGILGVHNQKQVKSWRVEPSSTLSHSPLCCTKAQPKVKELLQHSAIRSTIMGNGRVSAEHLQQQARSNDGVNINHTAAYRAKERVRHEDDAAYAKNFQILNPYLIELKRLNPGTTIDYQVDSNGRFTRLFFSAGCMPGIFEHACIKLVQLDAAHMKHHLFRQSLFVLETHDGNNELIPLAVGLAPIENAENHTWFLEQCKRAFGETLNNPDVAIISDRHKVRNSPVCEH